MDRGDAEWLLIESLRKEGQLVVDTSLQTNSVAVLQRLTFPLRKPAGRRPPGAAWAFSKPQ